LTRVRADFLAVRATMASRAFIRSAHNRHQKVFVWTVNDPLTMSTMIGRGVDGIITDHPALARQVLVERAELSCVERLLVNLAGLLGVTPQTAEQ
jgi:glycerophosphoryl diester phosphodiesterase